MYRNIHRYNNNLWLWWRWHRGKNITSWYLVMTYIARFHTVICTIIFLDLNELFSFELFL